MMKRILAPLFGCVCTYALASAATFTVTNTNDSGAGSLRAAIDSANNNAGPDTIAFNIPASDPGCDSGTGVCTIKPNSIFPYLNDAGTTIDGYTQPGAQPNTLAVGDNARLLIEIDGTNAVAFL